MDNYFLETPIFKIWIDLIDYLTPRTSFLINKLNFQFVDLTCSREGVIKTFKKEEIKLELVFAHENRKFFCRLTECKSGAPIKWRTTPPPQNALKKDFAELELEIDSWLAFLKTGL